MYVSPHAPSLTCKLSGNILFLWLVAEGHSQLSTICQLKNFEEEDFVKSNKINISEYSVQTVIVLIASNYAKLW